MSAYIASMMSIHLSILYIILKQDLLASFSPFWFDVLAWAVGNTLSFVYPTLMKVLELLSIWIVL